MYKQICPLILSLAFYAFYPLYTQTDASFSSNALCQDLMLYLCKTNKNTIYSPFSIYSSLSMVACGAEGETQQAMEKTLHWTCDRQAMSQAHFDLYQQLVHQDDTYPGLVLQTANALFLDHQTQLLKPFETTLNSLYQAPILPVDFQNPSEAMQTINEWVNAATHQKIPELLLPGDLNDDSQMVLINTLYFKGQWCTPFNPALTKESFFFYEPKKSVKTKIMYQQAQHAYFEDGDFQVIALPFKSSNNSFKVSFMVALPKQVGGIESLEHKIDVKTWIEQKQLRKIELFLPSIHLHQRIDLYEALADLGMEIAFSPSADFSSMSSQFNLAIGKAIHEVNFDLNEYGLEASAATSISMQRTAYNPENPLVFCANRPFFFFLVEEKTQAILFQGKYFYPSRV